MSASENVNPSKKAANNIYFLSGLGADKRVFSRLELDPRFKIHHIEWIRPEKKESLSHYAGRLIAQIDTTQPFQLVGLSFGGIIASEISDIVQPEKIILISSMQTGMPLGKGYQALIRFLLFSPLAAPILKSTNKYAYNYFGADTPELKKLLKDILHDTDSRFLKWALKRLIAWDRKTPAPDIFHIHGTADKLIQLKFVKPDVTIHNGGHLMVYGQAEEISKILNRELETAYR